MRDALRRGAFLALLALLPAQRAAEPPPVRPETAARIALGHFENGSGATCNGTLIAPRLVITAAHCVEERDGRGAGDPIRFRLGNDVRTPPRRMRRHPIHLMGLSRSVTGLRFDLALVELTAPPLGDDTIPVRIAGEDGPAPDSYLIASYEREAGAGPRVRECPVLARRQELIWLDCEVRSGDSGGAVFRMGDGELVLHAVLAARSTYLDGPVALAAEVAPRLEAVRARLDGPPMR